MRVVVTGGAGFIGANLCRTLSQDPAIDDVVALDNLSTGFRSNLDGIDATLIEGSILDHAALDEACAGATAIVHLAARPSVPRSIEDPMASHVANATGTLEVLEASRRHGGAQVIVASSSSVYGGNPTLPKSEDLAQLPLSPYAASKLATEAYALAYRSSYGIPTLAFRFFNVFGPLQAAGHAYAAVVPAFVDAALKGEPLTVHGDGLQTRDFTFVDTVADVIRRSILGTVTSDMPVNLAFGTRFSLMKVIEIIEAQLGTTLKVNHTDPRTGDVRDSQADSSRVKALFSDVEPVDLEQGIEATINWFKTLPTE